jgi:hypothetical protein
MPKAMSLTGLVVSIIVLLLFGIDLAVDFNKTLFDIESERSRTTMDVGFMLSAALLAYMSWTTYREQP